MIVEAVGIAVHAITPERAKKIELAMSQAVAEAQLAGISDTKLIRQIILEARDKEG